MTTCIDKSKLCNGILLLILLFLTACRPTRYIAPYQALLTRVKIHGPVKELNDQAASYVRQKPNRRFLLTLYNTFNTQNGHYKPASRIREGIGEAPAIYDTTLTERSTRQIQLFLKDNGYFDAKVDYTTIQRHKRAYVTYNLNPQRPFRVAGLSTLIQDTALNRLYRGNASSNLIKTGKIYTAANLDDEQTRLNTLFRENGYYRFTKQYIRFLVVDTLHNHTVGITEIVDNPDSGMHQKFYLDSITLTIHADTNNRSLTKLADTSKRLPSGLRYVDPYGRFKPIIARNTIYLEKAHVFSLKDQLVSYNRLSELGVFREIKITYKESRTDSVPRLEAMIDVTERKKLSVALGIDGNFNNSFYGVSPTATYTDRNFFKGAEVFEFRVGGTLNNTLHQRDEGVYNRREFSIQASLTYPFLLIPFYHARMGREGNLPHTTLSARYNYVFQPLYNRREYSATLAYIFDDTRRSIHTVTPVEATLLRANLDPVFRRLFTTYGNLSRLQSFTSSIIFGSQYNYERNAYLLRAHADFVYLNANIEVVGNTLALADHLLPGRHKDTGTLLGLPYYQYIKPEIDFRLYRKIGASGELIFRFNPGVAYAYGKTTDLKSVPFDRQFFVGGPNSVRGWLTRQLGPGSYISKISSNPDSLQIDIQRRAIDQTGEVKIEGNVEYRFDITRDFFEHRLSGAGFVDYGNIWLLRADSGRPGGNFQFNKFLRQLALGTGFGLRYDLGFFVFRFDIGLKLYDPIYASTDGWVIKSFGSKNFQREYLSRFGDDHTGGYHFISYNFGIGFPF